VLHAGCADAVHDNVGDFIAMIGRVEPPIDPDRRAAIGLDPARYDDPFPIGLAPSTSKLAPPRARLPRSPTKLAGSFVAAKLLEVSAMMLENRTRADSNKKRCIMLNPPNAVIRLGVPAPSANLHA
jgi:hypothetical protein